MNQDAYGEHDLITDTPNPKQINRQLTAAQNFNFTNASEASKHPNNCPDIEDKCRR